jgi:two-component system, NtrC family, sensor histidine kinase HydH
MEDMAQVVAHRIRGLVMTIEGFTDLLADSLVDRAQRELALRIFESAARIEGILADLQVFAVEPQPVPTLTSTAAVLVDLVASLDDLAAERVDAVIPEASVPLFADPLLVRQALLMLVTNALEATAPAGRITITCVDEDPVYRRFIVRNEGVIHEKVAEQAFQPFFTTKAHNLGVGLNLARRIAEVHGGDVRLLGAEPKGTTSFALDLPGQGGGEVVQ